MRENLVRNGRTFEIVRDSQLKRRVFSGKPQESASFWGLIGPKTASRLQSSLFHPATQKGEIALDVGE